MNVTSLSVYGMCVYNAFNTDTLTLYMVDVCMYLGSVYA